MDIPNRFTLTYQYEYRFLKLNQIQRRIKDFMITQSRDAYPFGYLKIKSKIISAVKI